VKEAKSQRGMVYCHDGRGGKNPKPPVAKIGMSLYQVKRGIGYGPLKKRENINRPPEKNSPVSTNLIVELLEEGHWFWGEKTEASSMDSIMMIPR